MASNYNRDVHRSNMSSSSYSLLLFWALAYQEMADFRIHNRVHPPLSPTKRRSQMLYSVLKPQRLFDNRSSHLKHLFVVCVFSDGLEAVPDISPTGSVLPQHGSER